VLEKISGLTAEFNIVTVPEFEPEPKVLEKPAV
jgi:hypothetical protein